MGKFNLHDFVMKTLTKMKEGGEDEYRVMQYALKYYEKGVLEDTDLEEVQKWFEEEKQEEFVEPTTYPKEDDAEWIEGNV
jgi:adenine C2-methylase RlmN of 23S rRNA A2503 and tRNA A37